MVVCAADGLKRIAGTRYINVNKVVLDRQIGGGPPKSGKQPGRANKKGEIRMPFRKHFAGIAALLLLASVFKSPTASANTVYTSDIQATTSLNGTFPSPNPRNQNSGLIDSAAGSGGDAVHATASDNYTYTVPANEAPPTWTVSGNVNTDISIGTMKFSSHLSATNNTSGNQVGMASYNTGSQFDVVTIVAAPVNGQIKVSDLIDGAAIGGGSLWSSDIRLQVTITNTGTNASKDVIYTMNEDHSRGSSGQSDSASGPTLIAVDVGDTLLVTMDESLSTNATSYPLDTYVTASYGNTTHLYIDAATPGVAFTTLSGHDYSSPVPLPPAWELLSVGLIMIPGMCRRRTKESGDR